MGKDCEGRVAGHHVTPGRGWRWQKFGDRLMLVTDGGGADVVLSGRHRGGGNFDFITCGPNGNMTPLTPESPIGVLLAGVPALIDVLRLIRDRDDRPHYMPRLIEALEAAGL